MSKAQVRFQSQELAAKCPELQSESAIGLVSIDVAVEELYAAVDKLGGALRKHGAALQPGDYDGALELVTEVRELFEHLAEHSEEAASALWRVSDIIASKLEPGTSP